MANPNSTTNRALWLMAMSLAVIAICLVMMVMRLHSLAKPETTQSMPSREPRPGEMETKHNVPAFARPERPHAHQEHIVTTIEPARVNSGRESETQVDPIMPVVAREPEQILPSALVPISAPETNTGTIMGRVFLQGKPPPEKAIHLDAFCGRVHLKSATTHYFVVSSDGGLANVLVYIKSGLKQKNFAVPAPAVVNQVGCEFVPSVLGLMAGQDLIITNSDAHLHNVDARVGKRILFNIAEQPDSFVEKHFSTAQDPNFARFPIYLKCDVHPWMEAYVWVLDHPFYAVTDSKGNYSITNVPPGEYELSVVHTWNPRSNFEMHTGSIAITNAQTTNLDVVIEAKNFY